MKGKKALVALWENDTKLESTDDHNFELIKILNGNKFETNREDGNVESAFKVADKIIERTYESPFSSSQLHGANEFFRECYSRKKFIL